MSAERRHIPFEVSELRVDSQEGGPTSIEGYAAVFDRESGDLGGFTERIAPGAFSDALGKSDVRVLFNHDPDHVLGRVKSGTAVVGEDDRGLRFRTELPDTQLARDLAHLVQRGDIDGASFAFTVEEDGQEWTPRDGGVPLRTITRVSELYDAGPVTYPAYTDTVVSARSLEIAKQVAEEVDEEVAEEEREHMRMALELEQEWD